MSKISCNNCKFALFQDYGYSNYTVEGTEFTCLTDSHPAGTFDRFYGENDQLNYAPQCNSYANGEPVHIDVDCFGSLFSDYTSDPEIAVLLDRIVRK